MRVARLELKDLGPFEDAALEIPPPADGQRGELVLFEGPNGSGKTTIAQALACLATPPPVTDGVRGNASFPEMLYLRPEETGFALMPPLLEILGRRRSKNATVLANLEAGGALFSPRIHELGPSWPGDWHRNIPEAVRLISGCAGAAGGRDEPLRWAAFAYQGHQPTPVVATRGPGEIETPPLRGALSFGTFAPASADFGQLLTNVNYEQAMAFMEAHKEGLPLDRREASQRLAESRHAMLARMEEALSLALDRAVRFDFPFGQHAPTVLVDGEAIALHLLGEGMRSTLSWLADLLVRLHRIPWASPEISPLEQDFWLILDEIDESLHPTMQMRILPTLRRLFPNARLYVTTHSPFVVASAGEGYVFSIRPDRHHRVSGLIESQQLEPGQSLEWVVEEVFGAETGFIDAYTRDALRAHRADIHRMRRKEPFGDADWSAFLERRAALMHLNEQVQTVVAMQEVPVQRAIDARLAAAGEQA